MSSLSISKLQSLSNNADFSPSDHNMINMQPIYRRNLTHSKPQEKEITRLTEESLESLNASFDITDWDMFINNAEDIDDLVDTVTDYIKFNTQMILPTKTLKQYPNNKPWINVTLRKLIVEKHNAFKTGDGNYREKQNEVDKAIERAKSEYKDKVEENFKTNKMKDAWKGLKLLTGQKESKKASSLTSTPGSADRLNKFYSRFDNIDYSNNHLSQKAELDKLVKDEAKIEITEKKCTRS